MKRRRVDFIPRTYGTWACTVCGVSGIGGLNTFYVHYYQEHHETLTAQEKGNHVR